MNLREIMTSPVFTVHRETPASDALAQMTDAGVRHAVVVSGPEILGVLSERDLGGRGGGLVRKHRTVGDLMHRDPVSASPETTLAKAARLAYEHHLGCLPVVDHGQLVGIVTRSDLLAALAGVRRQRAGVVREGAPRPPRVASPNRDKWP